jgi:hypothetical protein
MLDDIIKATYLRFGGVPFTATQFYEVVRATGLGSLSQSCRYWRTRGEYHGYVIRDGANARGASLFRLTPHGIARIENAA